MGTGMLPYIVAVLVLAFSASNVASAGCPDGWTSHRGQCFLYFRETYNWFNALEVCKKLGGHLAEDDSEIQHRFLEGILENHGGTNVRVWLGLQDFETEGTFMWTNSETQVGTAYWMKDQPDNKGQRRGEYESDCAIMMMGGWADENCEDARYSFICQL